MPHHRETLMIVEDSSANIMILENALNSAYKIISVNQPSKALAALKTNPKPDLLLLDIMMPEIDGFDLCRIIKQDPETQGIPIIFLTAKSNPIDEIKGLSLGAVDYIYKPYVIPVIKARIHTHLDLKRKYDLLESLALLDGLTEIANRRFLDENLEKEWRRNLRTSTPLGCIMLDIDYFKQYNDNYGHPEGDHCLKEVACVIKSCLNRGGDFVVRYGGEEFAVILPETDLDTTYEMALKIHKAIDELKIEHRFSPVHNCISASAGVASMVPEINIDPEELINRADDNLYTAKKNGRNRIIK